MDLVRVGEGDPFPDVLPHGARYRVEEESVVEICGIDRDLHVATAVEAILPVAVSLEDEREFGVEEIGVLRFPWICGNGSRYCLDERLDSASVVFRLCFLVAWHGGLYTVVSGLLDRVSRRAVRPWIVRVSP